MNQVGPIRLTCLSLALSALLSLSVSCDGGESRIGGVRSELVARAGDTVTGIAFSPDGRLFLTEQNSGDILIVTAEGQLLPEPFAHVELAIGLEWGLLNVAVDPEFEENHYVYVYFTQPAGPELNVATPVVMRFTEDDNRGRDPTAIADFDPTDPDLPPTHIGGGLLFGPDGYLYISIGDTERKELSQDLSSPFGKILRITRDGDPAPDNPFIDQLEADARVYAYGLRNVFRFTFDPQSGRLYANENGPSNCDELNIIEASGNYGWPQSLTDGTVPCQNPEGVEPIYHFTLPGKGPDQVGSNVAPTGIGFVSGQVYPALGDGLVMCEFLTKFMRRLQLAEPDRDVVTDNGVVVEDCTVALAVDDKGIVYYSIGSEIRRLLPQ